MYSARVAVRCVSALSFDVFDAVRCATRAAVHCALGSDNVRALYGTHALRVLLRAARHDASRELFHVWYRTTHLSAQHSTHHE
jgi:hypothetical protein